MSASTFDTHAAVKALQEAGADERLAEAITNEIRNGQGDLATKADIDGVKADIAGLRWIVGIVAFISLATLAGVVATATRIFGVLPAP